MRIRTLNLVASSVLLLVACADNGPITGVDSGVDASADANVADSSVDMVTTDSTVSDLGVDFGSDAAADATVDAGPNCLELGHTAGEHYAVGDACNFCDCGEDGIAVCTTRVCAPEGMSCSFGGSSHPYGVRFSASDGCNECACAASGVACTRRDCAPTIEDSAILLESNTEPCGDDPMFTVEHVLNILPYRQFTAPFLYERDREAYPEVNPDTTVFVRITYDGGIAACRIPMPGQEAIDIEVRVELITEDGKFNEAFHTYLRRDRYSMFVDWFNMAMSLPPGGLNGFYAPACFDYNGLGIGINIYGDGTAEGHISKACETDISLTVGTFNYVPGT